MKLFKESKRDIVRVNVGDRILRNIVVKAERKWWNDSPAPMRNYCIVESLVKEISPSGEYYCLLENEKDVWVKKGKLIIIERLKPKQKEAENE